MAKKKGSGGQWHDSRGRFTRGPNTWEATKALERQLSEELEAEGWKATVRGVTRQQLGGEGLGDAVRVWGVENESGSITRTEAASMLRTWRESGMPDAFAEREDDRFLVALKIELEDGRFEWRNVSAAEDWQVSLDHAIEAAESSTDRYDATARVVGIAWSAI